MSHFPVAVITDDSSDYSISEMLEPYEETGYEESPYTVRSKEEGEEYFYNPNAKWDWYVVGGRFSGMLKTAEGTCNTARIGDIIKWFDQEEYDKAIRWWEVVIEGDDLKPDEKREDFLSFFKTEYYKEQYGTKEEFAESYANLCPFAILNEEGWYEKGEMGWFGVSTTTRESRHVFEDYFKQYCQEHPDSYITIVDCHI